MEYKDYYDIMGVKRDATKGYSELKRAYRKLARKYHPDVSQEADAETKFKEVGEAYEVLKDPEKRAAYDQLGSQWQAGQDFHPPPGWDAGFEFSGGGPGARAHDTGGPDLGAFSDFFESLYGRDYSRAGATRRCPQPAGLPNPWRGPPREGHCRPGRQLQGRHPLHHAANP